VGAFDALINAFLPAARVIDAVNIWIGKRAAWLILGAVLVSAVNAIVRKVFDTSSNAWLELQWILFSAVFLFCAPWTLSANEHIRIDILHNMYPPRVRNSIEVIGHAFFLLPFCIILIVTGVPFARVSAPPFSAFLAVLAQFPQVFFDTPIHWPSNLLTWFSGLLGLGEQSLNAGGLPQWPAKSMIMIAFALLLLQGVSELIKRVAIMRGLIPDPHAAQKSSLETEAEQLAEALEQH
jgi:TRAP-type mannitol/chloroaromatic compound transport system permease small subunit